MPSPVRHLTVLQNWDCQACGNCCKDYRVTITGEERRRIEAQHWETLPEFQGVALFKDFGRRGNPRTELNRHEDGACVFLSDQGRCRIHERFGADAKPLPCRLFPFVFVPAGDHWRIGVRFACPSAAANHGRPLTEHDSDLESYAGLMAAGEGVVGRPAITNVPAPPMRPSQVLDWPDLLQFVQILLTLLRASEERLERRLRKCLAFDRLCRQAKMEKLTGNRLEEFLRLVAGGVDAQVPADPAMLSAPSWTGRILFRQILALLARKDEGGDRGIGAEGRLALLRATWRFARGQGPIPRVHGRIPDATFEQVEGTRRPLSREMESTLERYFLTKVGSLQFCGPMVFNLPFWEGLETLLANFPVVCWLTRLFADVSGVEAVQQAIAMVDRHFGYNRVLGTRRQRLAFRFLARMGELDKLIAWYGR